MVQVMYRSVAVDGSVKNKTVSETVVSKVAERTESDPLELEPLYGVIDPDALDSLFETDRGDLGVSRGRMTFTYCGCEVEISADGTVDVSEIA